MNNLSEIIGLLIAILIFGTFLAMIIHTNKLITKKKLSNAFRFFVLAGMIYPIVSIGIWIYAIYAKPRNKDQRLRNRIIPNILGGTVLSGALLLVIGMFFFLSSAMTPYSKSVPASEVDLNEVQENIGIKLDLQNTVVDTSFAEYSFQDVTYACKLTFNGPGKSHFTQKIKGSTDFITQEDTTFIVAKVIEKWPDLDFTNSTGENGERPGHWIQKNDSVFILNKTNEPGVFWTEAVYNSHTGELYYGYFLYD
jgi:hypothetical protein